MKIIFLLSFIFSFIFANQSQIVLGTFSTNSTAAKVKNSVEKLISKDKKFQKFIIKNSLKTVSKKHGKYFIVTIEPFNDIVTQYSVLNRIKKTKYKDAYVLELFPSKKIIIDKSVLIDDPLLMAEPDINSLEINIIAKKSDITTVKKEKKDIVIKERVTSKKAKELDVLETYFDEIIAAVAILILIVIYFMIKKSQQKQKNSFEDFTSIDAKQETKDEETSIIEDGYDSDEMVMEERTETIDFGALNGEEEGSFGIEADEKVITKREEETPNEPLTRTKRTVPPHGKITKENFKEFAGQKILVAEDNMINQKVITGLFADSGIEIILADDGQFTLDILEEDSDFNFILMDAHMPRLDGFEATRKIRKNPAYNHIVIIALSGDTAVDDIRKMRESGMEEQLEKPLRIEALYNIIYAYTQSDSLKHTGLDTEEGLSISGDDKEFYNEILDEFVKTYSESPIKLQGFLNTNSLQEADRYLLDLSGITANIGASNTSKIVQDLKEAINNPNERRYIALLKEYAKSLQNLLKDIKKYKED